jgi:Uma2 family endonuclease
MNATLVQDERATEWLSADEFVGSEWKGYELIDGKPQERLMSITANMVTGQLFGYLWNFNQTQPAGWLTGAETSFRLWPDRPNLIRKPDVSFIAFAKHTGPELPEGHSTIVPDLVAEIVSPNDKAGYLETKVEHYRQAGVRLIWVLYPATQTILVRRLNQTTTEIPRTGTLTGEDVLPGFSVLASKLFHWPQPPANPPVT